MAAEIGQLAPGTKCDRYDIVRLIGSGGMGEVYQAMHEFTKKQVALKVLRVSLASKDHHVEKMRAEAMVLCQIRHRHLVEVYDAGLAEVQTTHDGVQSLIWMAMELCEGESLRERLMREGVVRPAMALEWAAQIADGVQVAHDAQVIHRDLKPENIFITKTGEVRVLDFGTAKFDGFGHRPTRAADRVGTIPYMSPEHLNDDPLDGRSDIYALGFILYEMLAGRHPFSDDNGGFPSLDRLLPMVLAAEPESLAPHVGDAVWQRVARSVEKDRDERYPSMTQAAVAYRQVAATYGSDGSGVALRLSGSSATRAAPGPVPNAFAGAGGAQANSASEGSLANMTPPPLAAGVAPEPASGLTGRTLAAMALGAATLGALVVILLAGPRIQDASSHQGTHAAASGSPLDPAGATNSADAGPVAKADAQGPAPSTGAPPSASTTEHDSPPSTSASAGTSNAPRPVVPPTHKRGPRVVPPTPIQPPTRMCWSDEPIPRKIPCR